MDDLSSGNRDNVPGDARFEEIDIRNADKVEKVIADFKPNYISHQAAQASVAVSVREPQLDAEINILGGLNILSSAAKNDVERILFASTGGAIYGEVPDGTRAGLDTPPNPMSPYAASKFAFEKYLECFKTEHGLDYRVLRYANVYGPRQDPHGEAGVVAIFMNRFLAGEGIQINARKEAGTQAAFATTSSSMTSPEPISRQWKTRSHSQSSTSAPAKKPTRLHLRPPSKNHSA